ncbi:MAG TPA: zf-HC2 domain-containing protein [Thermoanaerobaculia bacterium]|jgi:hypothetical protein
MEHTEAIDTYAAEGYLLGELSDAERTAFEEHFADCDTCFADVKDALRFTTVLPKVVVEPVPAQPVWWRSKPALGFAAAVVLTASLQQITFVVPLRAQLERTRTQLANTRTELTKEREPHVVPVYLIGDQRDEIKSINGRAPYTLEFVIPPQYKYAVVDAHGKVWIKGQATAEEAKKPIDVYIPGGTLPPGDYSLLVTGIGGVSVSQAEFTVG